MHWFYGLLLMGFIFYLILKKLPDPPKEDKTSTREVHISNSKSKKKKNKKSKSKTQAQVQAKLNQKIQKKNTPPKGKTNELDENEWPSLEKINEDKKAATLEKSRKQKEKQTNKKNEFNVIHYEDDNSEDNNSNSNVEDSEEPIGKSSDKPVIIQNVSLPITNRKKYKKHVVQENQKYISSDDEEISDREVKVVRVVEKKEEIENIELPPEVDGWKNVVPKKANILVIKSASNPTPIVVKNTIRKPKEEPLTKKQKENKKKAEKRKLEKQRERELQEERLRQYRVEQKKQNIGYKYVPPPKPSNNIKAKPKITSKTPAQAPIINSLNNRSNNHNDNTLITAKVPTNGITSLWS